MSYAPVAPHYRYLHAPHRRYLPPDLTVAKMHNDYLQTAQETCSYETYRSAVNELNIGFTNLSIEECDQCRKFAIHKEEKHKDEPDPSDRHCEECVQHHEHMESVKSARAEYRANADRTWETNELVVSADMMRVTMLPVLPHKQCFFTRRLVCFNETFSVLKGKGKNDTKGSIAILWHEAIAARDAQDVASCYWTFFTANRDKRLITIFCDNCAAQNKCYVILTAILSAVNRTDTKTTRITLKYLTKGHTAMSADADHQKINKKLKKEKVVSDFQDFVNVVKSTGLSTHVMVSEDFKEFKDGVSESKLRRLKELNEKPLLGSMRVVQARRGSRKLFTKTSFNSDGWRAYDVLKDSFDPDCQPASRAKPRGGNKAKLSEICTTLLPLIEPHKREFWRGLQHEAKASSRDLISA